MAGKNSITSKSQESVDAGTHLVLPAERLALLRERLNQWELAFADWERLHKFLYGDILGLTVEERRVTMGHRQRSHPALYQALLFVERYEDELSDELEDIAPANLEEAAIFLRYFFLSGKYKDNVEGGFCPFDDVMKALCGFLTPITGVVSAFELE